MVPSPRDLQIDAPRRGWVGANWTDCSWGLIPPIGVVVVTYPDPSPAAPVGRDQTPAGVIVRASEPHRPSTAGNPHASMADSHASMADACASMMAGGDSGRAGA